jgi:hypothetical protein
MMPVAFVTFSGMGELKYNPGLIVGNQPTDFFLGVNSPIVHEARNTTRDWKQFRSLEEAQFNARGDWYNCTNQSGENQWEAQANWALDNNLWPIDALEFFNQNGYVINGRFVVSTRFNSKLSGTIIGKGNFLYKAQDSLRHHGVVPESRWPTRPDMSPQEYYAEIPVEITALGQESLKHYDWFYEFLKDASIKALDYELEHAPLQIGIAVCPGWNTGNVPTCGGPAGHAVLLESIGFIDRFLNIQDHSVPFSKRLALKYQIFSASKGVLYPKGKTGIEGIISPLHKDIALGDKGDEVIRLKLALKKLGWLPGYTFGETDVYDRKLADVVFNFQLANISRVFLEMLLAIKGRRVGSHTRAVINQGIKFR